MYTCRYVVQRHLEKYFLGADPWKFQQRQTNRTPHQLIIKVGREKKKETSALL
jgi:hypothetical protein